MRYTLRLVLILCLTLTGVGLGMARGTVQSGGQVVICTGQGIVVRHVPGSPAETSAHICPDMALSLLGALAVPGISVARSTGPRRLVTLPATALGMLRPMPAAAARDPPADSVSI